MLLRKDEEGHWKIYGWKLADEVEDVTKVTVYSNLPKVELFANGVSLGVREAEDHFFRFEVPNAGHTHLVAVAGELKDESELNKVAVFNEAYRLKEKSAILNWFDITAPEGYTGGIFYTTDGSSDPATSGIVYTSDGIDITTTTTF